MHGASLTCMYGSVFPSPPGATSEEEIFTQPRQSICRLSEGVALFKKKNSLSKAGSTRSATITPTYMGQHMLLKNVM